MFRHVMLCRSQATQVSATQSSRISHQRSATPCHCNTLLRDAVPLFAFSLQGCSILRGAIAARFVAFRCLCWAVLINAFQLPCTVTLSRCDATQCWAPPLHCKAILCLCLAALINASPLLCYSFLAMPSQSSALPRIAIALPGLSRPGDAIPLQSSAGPRTAIAVPRWAARRLAIPQLSSSQVNRPLPELRHWPRPRRAP